MSDVECNAGEISERRKREYGDGEVIGPNIDLEVSNEVAGQRGRENTFKRVPRPVGATRKFT